MDRNEAMLRELHLYPQWKLRGQLAVKAGDPLSAEAEAESTPPVTAQQAAPITVAVEESALTAPALVAPLIEPLPIRQPSVPMSPVTGLDWPELKQQVHDCTACKLRGGCTQTVFGVGDEQADWLFIGEAPGADEDALGEPFVGEAGKLLDNMLAAIKLKRGNNVYITNTVKCRPPADGSGRQLPPKPDEIAQCMPYLQRQIALIQPKLIVALGKTAANALLGCDTTLGSLRGTLHDYHGIPLVITYHPAYLLRSPMEKAKAWQDLRLAVATCAVD